MSKNRYTIEQLKIACRHVSELVDAGVTQNHAIRTLELMTDYYAKLLNRGAPAPHHVKQVPRNQWSVAARKWDIENPGSKPGRHLRVEHGTPRRGFARKVLELYERDDLSEGSMKRLTDAYWKLAVITLEEDSRLSQNGNRSKLYDSPDERWKAAGIVFEDGHVEQRIARADRAEALTVLRRVPDAPPDAGDESNNAKNREAPLIDARKRGRSADDQARCPARQVASGAGASRRA